MPSSKDVPIGAPTDQMLAVTCLTLTKRSLALYTDVYKVSGQSVYCNDMLLYNLSLQYTDI